jgi:uncharacterized protein (DUF2236 family)
MSAPIMPPAEEWARLTPRPGTITWQRASDARMLPAAGYALLLQVSHPTVGAGVTEHSQFQRDPWGRLWHTLDYTYTMVYGGPEAAAQMGKRIRLLHRRIRGTKPDGTPYSALEPEAYAWVHATLAEAIVGAHERFGRPFGPRQSSRFWSEWRALGRLLGIRDRELPEDWPAFRGYVAEMVEHRLVHTPAVDEVLGALARPAPPGIAARCPSAWTLAWRPAGHFLGVTSGGLLPGSLRRRFGIRWTLANELELRALGAALRGATPLTPPWLRNTGPGYLRWRKRAIVAEQRTRRSSVGWVTDEKA